VTEPTCGWWSIPGYATSWCPLAKGHAGKHAVPPPVAAPPDTLASAGHPVPMKRYEDADWCRAQYEGGATYREMAVTAGCSLRTIARWMKLHGIEVPTAVEKRLQRGTSRKPGPATTCACGRRKWSGTKTCAPCRNRSGESNPRWRGPEAGNRAAHQRVMALHGKATDHPCADCGGLAAHWAYDHLDPDELPSDDGPYSTKVEHYRPMCVPCHKRFDLDYLRRTAA
jgi:hypothetical protein